MDNVALESAYLTNGRNLRDEELLWHAHSDEVVRPLSRRVSLMLALLLSLGLWAAIGMGVASLTWAILG